MNKHFIKATEEYCDIYSHVPSPMLRKSFTLLSRVREAEISICGLGFYRLFINGREITKGHIAPYISNPDHICYYDKYDLSELLCVGENVIGILLGNGFMNCLGGVVWDFDKAEFRGAPRVALEFVAKTDDGEISFFADESFKAYPSAILMDDLRLGEIYDAREEQKGWADIGFDDSRWRSAILASAPHGELKLCTAEPIAVQRELKPVSVTRQGDAYLYDFGINTAGVCRMSIEAERGQQVTLWHGEILKNGEFYNDNVANSPEKFLYYKDYNQTVRYTASGDGREIYTPSFCYQGFRYVLVEGITEAQATPELLTYLVMSADIRTFGGFSCSDERVNRLFEMCVNADRSNMFYFPTDCPQREKNGWTGDASISADHMALMYDVESSWREWLCNIRKAQNDRGELPGIVPTALWGFKWGNGPAWDSVLFNLPYMLFKFRGNTEIVLENADAMLKYLEYIMTRRSENGTVAVGLGDWVPVGKVRSSAYDAPLALTDSVMVMDMAKKAYEMLASVGLADGAEYAEGIYKEMRETVRRELIDTDTMTVSGSCQSSQCISLYYGVFDADEEPRAFERLLEFIHAKGDTFDCGFIGMHAIFHVLTRFGRSDLAYNMIMGEDYPSYGHLIEIGETALPEKFIEDPILAGSHNHHFLGDISRWFIFNIGGLEVIDSTTVKVAPADIEGIDFAEAFYELPVGRVSVRWEKAENGEKAITVDAPTGVTVCRGDKLFNGNIEYFGVEI